MPVKRHNGNRQGARFVINFNNFSNAAAITDSHKGSYFAIFFIHVGLSRFFVFFVSVCFLVALNQFIRAGFWRRMPVKNP